MANPPKKRKTVEDNRWPAGDETAEGTTQTGSKLLESLRQSKDKTGRPVANQFLALPPRSDAAYYRKTRLPLSFKEIETKLDAREYPNLTALESDLKRMVQNAKEFHSTGSKLFEDAERIRKAISNFMPKHNPAYRDEEYRAIATPIPTQSEDHSVADADEAEPEATDSRPPVTLKLRMNGSTKRRSSMVKKEKMAEDNGVEADGGNLQEVQLEVVDEMIGLRDPDDEETEITNEFYEKPSKRAYPDYYQQIQHPTALKDIRKAVAAGKFPDWQTFITEVEYLWNNALAYNEDDSFIYDNAIKLRDWFIERLSSVEGARDHLPAKKLILLPPKREIADAALDTPTSGTRIKLTNKRKVESGMGITVDEEARRRQHAHVQAASQPVITPAPIRKSSPVKAAAAGPVEGMQPTAQRPTTAASESDEAMHDVPNVDPNVQVPNRDSANDAAQDPAAPMQPPSTNRPAAQTQIETVFDTITRAPGKGFYDGLYSGVVVHTREEQNLEHPFVHCFSPSWTHTQQRQIVTILERQAKLRVVAAIRPFVLNRERHRVLLSLNDNEIAPSRDWGDGSYEWFVDCPLGIQRLEFDVMCHLNDKGEPAPIWPAERFEFECMKIDFHVRPDWHNIGQNVAQTVG